MMLREVPCCWCGGMPYITREASESGPRYVLWHRCGTSGPPTCATSLDRDELVERWNREQED